MQRKSRHAFTLVELLVVVAIISLLVAMLLPSLAGARDRARLVLCASNLKALGTAANLYQNDNDGMYPFRSLKVATDIGISTYSRHWGWDQLMWSYFNSRDFSAVSYSTQNFNNVALNAYASAPTTVQSKLLVCPFDTNADVRGLVNLNSYAVQHMYRNIAGSLTGLDSASTAAKPFLASKGPFQRLRGTGVGQDLSPAVVPYLFDASYPRWQTTTFMSYPVQGKGLAMYFGDVFTNNGTLANNYWDCTHPVPPAGGPLTAFPQGQPNILWADFHVEPLTQKITTDNNAYPTLYFEVQANF